MSHHLNPEQREQLERLLRTRIATLRQQLDAHQEGRTRAEHARDVLLQDGDDAPQRDADREVEMALTDLDTAEIAALQQALQRMQAGAYGRCHECGGDIPHARLLLEPQALRCVTCEAARERGAPAHPRL